jgi:hypothetical protein
MWAPVLLKPSEYQGAQGTAVAGRIVICSTQEVESRSKTSSPAAPSKGKGGKGKAGKATLTSSSAKIELHLSGTESASEVLYVEAWGELAQQVQKKCQVGDLVTISGGTIISAAQQYSTSKLHYHLRLKGVWGVQVIIAKVETLPWSLPPTTHPLVPLVSLSRVRDRQQICVAAVVVENPGSSERLTSNGTASVCNAIIQEGMTRVRCAFCRDMADKLASVAVNTCILLYQVLVSKKPGDTASWELGSWRGTQILPCPDELAEHVKLDLTWFATNCMTICRHILTSFPVLVHIIINVVLFSKVFECSMLQSCYCPCLLC